MSKIKRLGNSNHQKFFDKTQKGGGIWVCPNTVEFDNINDGLDKISDAQKQKLIKLIYKARAEKSKGVSIWFSSYRPGYDCLIKYLEAYYTLTTDITKSLVIRTIKTDNLIAMGKKKRFRILLGLIYLYLKKNITLTKQIEDTFYKKFEEVKNIKLEISTTQTATSKGTSESTTEQKKKFYSGIIESAKILIGSNTDSETELIMEYDNKLKKIKQSQSVLETKSYENMSKISTRILEEQAKQAQAQQKFIEKSINNINQQQILDMKTRINESLIKILKYMTNYNGDKKQIYTETITKYKQTYQQVENVNSNSSPEEKKKLIQLEQDVLTFLVIIEKILNPKDKIGTSGKIFKKDVYGFKSPYGMTSQEINEAISKNEIINILNEMDPKSINIDETINPNMIKILSSLEPDSYQLIKIEIRNQILSSLLSNDQINTYYSIVIKILNSMTEAQIFDFEKNISTKDKLKSILSALGSNIDMLSANTIKHILKIYKIFQQILPIFAENITLANLAKEIIYTLNTIFSLISLDIDDNVIDAISTLIVTSGSINANISVAFINLIVSNTNIDMKQRIKFIKKILKKIIDKNNPTLANAIIIELSKIDLNNFCILESSEESNSANNMDTEPLSKIIVKLLILSQNQNSIAFINKVFQLDDSDDKTKFINGIFNNIVNLNDGIRSEFANGLLQALQNVTNFNNIITYEHFAECYAKLIYAIAENNAQQGWITYAAFAAVARSHNGTNALSVDHKGDTKAIANANGNIAQAVTTAVNGQNDNARIELLKDNNENNVSALLINIAREVQIISTAGPTAGNAALAFTYLQCPTSSLAAPANAAAAGVATNRGENARDVEILVNTICRFINYGDNTTVSAAGAAAAANAPPAENTPPKLKALYNDLFGDGTNIANFGFCNQIADNDGYVRGNGFQKWNNISAFITFIHGKNPDVADLIIHNIVDNIHFSENNSELYQLGGRKIANTLRKQTKSKKNYYKFNKYHSRNNKEKKQENNKYNKKYYKKYSVKNKLYKNKKTKRYN